MATMISPLDTSITESNPNPTAGADLSREELIMVVIPKRLDEFTCASCFLVHHRCRIA